MSLTLAEIDSQPAVWRAASVHLDALAGLLRAPGERMLLVGSGTSAFVAAAVARLREDAGFGETDWAYSCDLPGRRRYQRLVAITRSGTTSELLAVLARPPAADCGVLTAVAGSPAAELADRTVVLAEADERSVVQTRFPTTTLLLARAAFGPPIDAPALGERTADDPVQDVLVDPLVRQCAAALSRPLPLTTDGVRQLVFLGSGWTLGLAHEAALKVRESAQAWAESYPALDYRHGPIAVAGPGTLVWIFGAVDPDLVADIERTGARTLHAGHFADGVDPLVLLVLAQRFAARLALQRGLDPDQPRHLTRSVILPTVAHPNGATS
jgi:fructoselysine-6-P-deglycase FrlB-like protein